MSTTTTGLSTHQKALEINLNSLIYGTFAEIGAGQEVVRWFFRVGGAASTVTKSMSAYDMNVSDAIYGQTKRYVSKERLIQMLDHEYSLNIERLSHLNRNLFAFADTIAAKNFKGDNDPHGWMGLRFQNKPGAEPSQLILHLRMHDRDAVTQQEALGIVGVNMLYAAFFLEENNEQLLQSLLDDLSYERVHIDMIEFSGEKYKKVDNRLKSLFLVKHGLSEIAMFDANGKVLQPSEVFYKKPVLIERGTFRPVTKMHCNILESSKAAFKEHFPEHIDNLLVFMEITMNNLLETGEMDPVDFLARADTLAAINQPVLITRYPEFYRLSRYLSQYTSMPIVFAMGGGALAKIINIDDYTDLEGGFMEAMSKLFRKNVKAFIYPQISANKEIVTAESFKPPKDTELLYKHLLQQGHLVTVKSMEKDSSPFTSKEVIRRMKAEDESWKDLVPTEVADTITKRKLFGYRG